MKKCENPLIPELVKTVKKRQVNLSSLKLPDGMKRRCVWCLSILKGQQRRWCGQECVDSAMAWAYPQKEYGLSVLLIRQEFKCNICKFDYGEVVEKMYAGPRMPYSWSEMKDKWRTTMSYAIVARLKDHLHIYDKPHRLEVDHILAISKGGQSVGLDNHQAICFQCHKEKTKKDLSGKRRKKNEEHSTENSDQLRDDPNSVTSDQPERSGEHSSE